MNTLIVLHYHFRPGGVRRVIERALPCVTRGKIEKVLLASGEKAPVRWLENLRQLCPDLIIEERTEPGLGYTSEMEERVDRSKLRTYFRNLLAESPSPVVWVHNPALARNIPMVAELVKAGQAGGATLVFHHHDLWCDNRWGRWTEAKQLGYRNPGQVADAIFPNAETIIHVGINRSDFQLLNKSFGPRAAWMPNSFDPAPPPPKSRILAAKRWLREQTGTPARAPLWVLPCRLLRRKNVAEALFLCRLMDPGSVVLTTGAASSSDEMPYFEKLRKAARKAGWPLHMAALEGKNGPDIDSVIAAADVLVLSSLQEGFGLTYLEAAAAGRPLVCRELPNVHPDLSHFGFEFPHGYRELFVPTEFFKLEKERNRQESLWREWKKSLPSPFQKLAGRPMLLESAESNGATAFSRLTLSAQLEVLQNQPKSGRGESPSWQNMGWPDGASKLTGENYARRFWKAVRQAGKGSVSTTPEEAQEEFVRARLDGSNLYPLLMATQS